MVRHLYIIPVLEKIYINHPYIVIKLKATFSLQMFSNNTRDYQQSSKVDLAFGLKEKKAKP